MIISDKEYFSRTADEYRIAMRQHAERWNQERLDGRQDLVSLILAVQYRDHANRLRQLGEGKEPA